MNIDYKLADATEIFLELYRRNRDLLHNSSPGFISDIREEAISSLEKLKIPGSKSEDYKYLRLDKLLEQNLDHVFAPRKIDFNIDDIFSCDIPELDTEVLLVLNGYYLHRKEGLTTLDNGVIYGSLKAAAKKYPDLVSKHYGRYADHTSDSLTALNAAFAQDGVFLYVPSNQKPERPFQIIHLLLEERDIMVQHRNLFILEENAEAEVLICDHTLSTHAFLTNSVTEIYAGKNAEMNITRVQNEHNGSSQLTNLYTWQERDSRTSTNYITLHGGVVRNNVRVYLNGENADNKSFGLYLSDQDQHIDNFTYVNHMKPHCTSDQLYKGILDDKSTGAFNGRIHVWPDAQKTMAYQRNNNLLLTDSAKMKSKPQLEIYADDVKCSHGATVGQLDEEGLFYLRSRGIPFEEARHLMMYAFAKEVLSNIKLPALRERMNELVDKRLRGELSRCNNCKMKCR